ERYYEGRVQFTRRYRVPENASLGDIEIAGKAAWMMCNSGGCQPPIGFEFRGTLHVSDEDVAGPLAMTIGAKLRTPQALEAIENFRLPKRETAAVNAAPVPAAAPEPRSAPQMVPAAAPLAAGLATRLEARSGDPVRVRGVDRSQGLPLFLLAAAVAG